MEISGSDEDLFASDEDLFLSDEIRLRPSLLSSTVNTFAKPFINAGGQLGNNSECLIIENSAETSAIKFDKKTRPKHILKNKIMSDSEESNSDEISLNSDEAEITNEETENEESDVEDEGSVVDGEGSEAEEDNENGESESDMSIIIPVRKKRNQIEDEESDAEDEGSEAEEAEEETNNENGESEADMSIIIPVRKKRNQIKAEESDAEDEGSDVADEGSEAEKEGREVMYEGNEVDNQVSEGSETEDDENEGKKKDELKSTGSKVMRISNPHTNGQFNESLDETIFTDNLGVIESNVKMEKLDDSSILINKLPSSSKKSRNLLINESYRTPRKTGYDSDDSVHEISSEKSAATISSDDESFLYEKPIANIPPRTPKVLIQQNLKEMIARNTPVKQQAQQNPSSQGLKHCTKKEYEVQQQKVEMLRKKIFETEKALQNFDLENLPDGGRLLKKRSADLGIELQKEEEILMQLARPGTKIGGDAVSWQELQKLANKVQPGGLGGKQAMETYNEQKELIMNHLKSCHGSLKARPDKTVMADDPHGLKIELMPHQKHALAFLQWRETQSPPGGLLADDMGLGKTLTMISLILKCKETVFSGDKNKKKREEIEDSDEENDPEAIGYHSKRKSELYAGGTLIVCPASLVNQWAAEIQRRCSRNLLTVGLYHGPNRMTKASQLANFDVVITTYNLVGRERDMIHRLNGIKWERIILDEAHVVRNYKSQSSQGVCNLRGKYRWCLTGTPIQNKELDIFALFKFLKCRPLDELSIWKRWVDNKNAGGQDRLNVIIQSIMLRRTKEELQNEAGIFKLPEKEIKFIDVALTKEESIVYQKILFLSQNLFAQFLHQQAEKNADLAHSNRRDLDVKPNEEYLKIHRKLSKINGNEPINSAEIMVLILRLRQICCHPGLIKIMLDAATITEEGMEDEHGNDIDLLEQIEKLNIEEDLNESIREGKPDIFPPTMDLGTAATKVLNSDNPIFNFEFRSSKIALIIGTLKQNVIPQGDKVVIVSQWTSMLEVIEAHLLREGIQSEMLSGKVPVPKRMMMVDAFNSPTNKLQVLLLSLTAGGVGLNLVGANHLMLIDLHWNPQLETQAMDRIYRMGQKKPVTIYKLMILDSIEERIKCLQEKKLSLADGILTGSAQVTGSKLTIEDMKMLFNMA